MLDRLEAGPKEELRLKPIPKSRCRQRAQAHALAADLAPISKPATHQAAQYMFEWGMDCPSDDHSILDHATVPPLTAVGTRPSWLLTRGFPWQPAGRSASPCPQEACFLGLPLLWRTTSRCQASTISAWHRISSLICRLSSWTPVSTPPHLRGSFTLISHHHQPWRCLGGCGCGRDLHAVAGDPFGTTTGFGGISVGLAPNSGCP